MKNKHTNIIITIIVALVVGAAGFVGGMQYQKSQAVNAQGSFAGPGGTQRFMRDGTNGNGNRMMGNGQGMRPVNGEIISSDDTSITVKMQDGSTKLVILSDKTTVNKATTGSKSDLKTGELVTAFGSTNADGSITAQMVSLGTGMFRERAQQ